MNLTLQLPTFILIFISVSSGLFIDPSSTSNFLTINIPKLKNPIINKFLHNITDEAVKHINQQGELDSLKQLKELELSSSQIAEATAYSFVVQVDDMYVGYEFISIVPPEATWTKHGHSSESLTNAFQNPRLSDMHFEGPTKLMFNTPRDDVRLKLPKEVDTGNKIQTLNLNPGVAIDIQGISEISLANPIDVEMHDQPNQNLHLHWKQAPKLLLRGKNILFNSEDRVKVKANSILPYEVDLFNATAFAEKTPLAPLRRVSFDLPADNPIVKQLHQIINNHQMHPALPQQQSAELEKRVSELTTSSVKRIISGKATAVTLAVVPFKLEDVNSGLHSFYKATIMHDSEGNRKVLNINERHPVNVVTIAPSMAANTTINEVLQSFRPASPIQALDIV